jgi:predicted nucleic acid-binding protein
VESLRKERLDRGEAEAIALYQEKSADYLLIDERLGRKVAQQYGSRIIGSLGILLKAKQTHLLDAIGPCIERLKASTIRIASTIYDFVMKQANEI